MSSQAKFKLGQKIGYGSFGHVFSATNIDTQEEVAIKVEAADTKVPQLHQEAKLYEIFHSNNSVPPVGIPKVKQFNTNAHYNILAMDLLGPSLGELFRMCDYQFSLKTVLMIADQLIARLEFIHNKGYLHRDIKPDNFVIGTGKQRNVLYIIDFGLSKRFMKGGWHVNYADGKKLVGTVRYSSINTHKGIEQSRRDDLEALGYVLIYFIKGELPWQHMKTQDKLERHQIIGEAKERTSVAELCTDLPKAFSQYMEYVRGLDYYEKPDYQKLRSFFKDLFAERKYTEDFEFDWVIKERRKKINLFEILNATPETQTTNDNGLTISPKVDEQKDTSLAEKKSHIIKKLGSGVKTKAGYSIFSCFI